MSAPEPFKPTIALDSRSPDSQVALGLERISAQLAYLIEHLVAKPQMAVMALQCSVCKSEWSVERDLAKDFTSQCPTCGLDHYTVLGMTYA